ncbi:MAG: S46 family peptidase [Bacteroidaceae bacterium]|nr:S46 family peptidase [Bacteroidaceae bacterium]
MKKNFASLIIATCSLFLTTPAKADEGMWVVGNISESTDSVLHSLGLELTAEQLYSADAPSLSNVVVQFGGFCSGAVVSPNGLVFTNHHCGFGSIQANSSVKHDYLKNGFIAKSYKEELPNEGLYVLFHIKTIDVTDKILGRIPAGVTGDARDRKIDSLATSIEEIVNCNNEGLLGSVQPFYKGSKYFLSVYQRYDDVRLVCAPPQCLGKYGGDTDNWMWPRQTCDFSVFRIYAGKDNRPAQYSKDNVPFKPLTYAKVSTQGFKEGDYVMTMGYPGSTDRYLSSYGIWNTMRCTNDVRYQVRGVKLDIINAAMRSSDALRIMYASKQASSSNYWKFSLGQNTALDNLKVLDEKRALEAQIQKWVMEDTVARRQYVGILDSLKVIYERNYNVMYTRNLFMESFISGSDILNFILYRNMFGTYAGDKPFGERAAQVYKDLDVDTDKKVFAALLKNYLDKVPEERFKPKDIVHMIDSAYNGNVNAYVDALYEKSVFSRPESLTGYSQFSEVAKDPMVDFTMSIVQLLGDLHIDGSSYEYERLLGDALREMNHSKDYYPDANFTLRMSYGVFEPINFAAGTTGLKEEARNLVTTPQSFLNKHDNEPENYDYELIDPVYKWMKKGKFSAKYIDPITGKLPLCYLTTNDITGGNSGSGMYDGKGRLVGLAFDGNWEAMSGDIKFDRNLQRCIGVDVRWILSVIEDYFKGKNLINEMTIE